MEHFCFLLFVSFLFPVFECDLSIFQSDEPIQLVANVYQNDKLYLFSKNKICQDNSCGTEMDELTKYSFCSEYCMQNGCRIHGQVYFRFYFTQPFILNARITIGKKNQTSSQTFSDITDSYKVCVYGTLYAFQSMIVY